MVCKSNFNILVLFSLVRDRGAVWLRERAFGQPPYESWLCSKVFDGGSNFRSPFPPLWDADTIIHPYTAEPWGLSEMLSVKCLEGCQDPVHFLRTVAKPTAISSVSSPVAPSVPSRDPVLLTLFKNPTGPFRYNSNVSPAAETPQAVGILLHEHR